MKTTLALVALLVLASVSYASACSCMMPGTPADEMGKSDAVFAGRVIKIDMPVLEDGTFGAGSAKVTLEVSQIWKGLKSKTITVSTATNSAACGFLCESAECTAGFREGSEYIVYASDYSSDGTLSTSICTRTKLLAEAQEDLSALGAGMLNPVDLPVVQGLKCDIGCYALLLAGIALVVAIVLAIYLKKVRKQKVNKK